MRVWAWLIGIVAGVWSVIWLIGSMATERVVATWLDQQENAGWMVGYDDIQTSGYPIRFSTVLTGLDLADPHTGWAWQGDEFHLIQPSYQPQNVQAIWPDEHVLSTPFEHLTIRSQQMEAMLHVLPGSNMALQASQMQIRAFDLLSDMGWSSQIDDASFLVTRQNDPAARYAVMFSANGFTPAGEVLRFLDPRRVLPASIDSFVIDSMMEFDRVWDLTALETARPGITRIELTELRATWGDLSLRASGNLDVDAQGIPTGDLAVRAQNWPEMIELGVNAGAIPEAMRSTLQTGLALIANLSGRPTDLDATLSFADGQVYLGPIPLGPAPVFILR